MSTRIRSFWKKLKDLDMFFEGKDEVHRSTRRLVRRLDKAAISYALVGGMALYYHDYRRATNDVDVLMTPEGFAEFRRRFVGKNYESVPGRGRRFVDRLNQITVDVLVTGAFPGTGKPGPFAYPDPAQVSERTGNLRVVALPTLVQLKLAARRHRDFGDVVELIRIHNLDEAFLDNIHPSVRQDFIECLEEKRREDEYEAREG